MSEYYSLKCTRLSGRADENGILKQCDGYIEHGFGTRKILCPKCGHRTMRKQWYPRQFLTRIIKVTAISADADKD